MPGCAVSVTRSAHPATVLSTLHSAFFERYENSSTVFPAIRCVSRYFIMKAWSGRILRRNLCMTLTNIMTKIPAGDAPPCAGTTDSRGRLSVRIVLIGAFSGALGNPSPGSSAARNFEKKPRNTPKTRKKFQFKYNISLQSTVLYRLHSEPLSSSSRGFRVFSGLLINCKMRIAY